MEVTKSRKDRKHVQNTYESHVFEDVTHLQSLGRNLQCCVGYWTLPLAEVLLQGTAASGKVC